VVEASELLRPGLLDGVSLLLASTSPEAPAAERDSLGATMQRSWVGLGARVSIVELITDPPDAEEAALDGMVAAAQAELGSLDLLVVDGTALFASESARGQSGQSAARSALRTCLHSAWNVTRAVVNVAFVPAGRGGRILYLAPPAGAGEHAGAAAAGLENLARTLSIEWARHAITAVAIAPGEETSAAELSALSAYLASPAGAYFSGCLLDLRGPDAKS
jgi:NAD(P)-dependent dehydrogenase (short-subunit alcohol dehydrogenase family)